jgi:hypothetical protein
MFYEVAPRQYIAHRASVVRRYTTAKTQANTYKTIKTIITATITAVLILQLYVS